MPSHNDALTETGIVADLRRRSTRHGSALAAVQIPQPAKQSWTVATNSTSPTLQLSYLPYNGTLGSSINLSWNDLEIREGTDYTVDYSTGLITLASGVVSLLRATPTPADVLTVDYWTTGDLVAAAITADRGVVLVNTSFNSATSASMTTALPASVTSGDYLLFAVTTTLATTRVATPSGWTLIHGGGDGTGTGTNDTNQNGIVLFGKLAGAGEGAPTATCSASQAYTAICRAYRGPTSVAASGANWASGTPVPGSSWSTPQVSGTAGQVAVHWWMNYYPVTAKTMTLDAALTNVVNPNFGAISITQGCAEEDLTVSGTTPLRTATTTAAPQSWVGFVVTL